MMKMFSVGGFGSSSVDNEIFLIRSHDIAVRTVKALGLTSTYIERDGLKKHLLFPNSPVKATMPQSVLDTLAFPFLIRVEISPDQHVNAKTMRGRLFWRTTFDEVKDATLPVNLDTPYGPVTLTAGDMSLLDGKKMDIDIVISGVKTAALKLEKIPAPTLSTNLPTQSKSHFLEAAIHIATRCLPNTSINTTTDVSSAVRRMQ